ncbi:hypothetical protein RCL1_002220 [Eukaryota sp. TZLM3-RCL]
MSFQRSFTLNLASQTIQCPAPLLHSSSGNPPGLVSRDANFPNSYLLHLSFSHIWDKLQDVETNMSLSQFYSHSVPVLVSPCDITSNDADAAYDSYISLQTPAGRLKCTPELFTKFINRWKPDFAILPADDVNMVSQKRAKTALNRTRKWTLECVENRKSETLLFLPIDHVIGSKLDSDDVMKSSNVGVSLNHYDLLSTPLSDVSNFLQSNFQSIPRHATCLGHPLEILELISAGFDLISVSFHVLCANQHLALTFLDQSFSTPFIKVEDPSFLLDSTPISSTCTCLCCRQYSRQYINHLLKTHEMLGESLLLVHNSFVIVSFFDLIREHVANNSFDSFKQKMIDRINKKC